MLLRVSCTFDVQDDAIVHELATARKGTESQSWLQWVNAWLFDRDVFKGVSTDDVVMRIHATAEEFDAGAEKLFTPWQVCMLAMYTCYMHMRNAVDMHFVAKVSPKLGRRPCKHHDVALLCCAAHVACCALSRCICQYAPMSHV